MCLLSCAFEQLCRVAETLVDKVVEHRGQVRVQDRPQAALRYNQAYFLDLKRVWGLVVVGVVICSLYRCPKSSRMLARCLASRPSHAPLLYPVGHLGQLVDAYSE